MYMYICLTDITVDKLVVDQNRLYDKLHAFGKITIPI
jgi:hypothetical protein